MWELDCEEGWAPKNWCFELWYWRRLLRVSSTARSSNQSILKDPEDSGSATAPAVRRSSHSLRASVAVPAGWEGWGEHHSRQSTAHDLCSHDTHRHSLSRAMPSYIITWRRWSHTAGMFWPFMSVGPCVGWHTGQTGPRRYTASSRMVGAFLLNVYTL